MSGNEIEVERKIAIRREVVFVGVLPYPITFLCTDFICELYGKALWLGNNGSTLTSQMVDLVAVILITCFFSNAISIAPGETVFHGLVILILSKYVFKMTTALVDTLPFYLGTRWLSRYLQKDPNSHFV